MLSFSEEGQQVDYGQIMKELSHISDFMGGSDRGERGIRTGHPP